ITWRAIRKALAEREIWVVGGFIFFWTFSPSFGPALLYYQTDVLHFSQQFIGHLGALGAVAGVVGALLYGPLSRLGPLTRPIPPSTCVGGGGASPLSALRGPPFRSHHRRGFRLRGHDHPARLPRSRGQILPPPHRGDVLRPPHVHLQRRHPDLAEHRGPALRFLRLHSARPRLDGLHRPGVGARADGPDRPHRGQGEGGRDARHLMRLVRLGLLLCGAALFLWLVVSIGPGAIIQAFRDLSWGPLIILFFPFWLSNLPVTLA